MIPEIIGKRRILVADDDIKTAGVLRRTMRLYGYDVVSRRTVEDALDALAYEHFDLVISELTIDGRDGLEICRAVAERHPHIPVIIFASRGDVRDVSAAMRAGASDFVLKLSGLRAIDDAVRRAAGSSHARSFQPVIFQHRHFLRDTSLIGRSRKMREVHELIARAAPTDATVFIVGEPGTGKELVAHALHRGSRRAGRRFMALSCGATSEDVLKIELFGYARGAFNRTSARRGMFAEAEGGTLFLDEVSELSLSMQAKLLKVIQERVIYPVGSDKPIAVHVRLIAATEHPIDAEVEAGRFRADLFYRLHVVQIALPPLRERGLDVEELTRHFITMNGGSRVDSISSDALEKLLSYPFPGNVRELESIIGRCCALAKQSTIQVEDLPAHVVDQE